MDSGPAPTIPRSSKTIRALPHDLEHGLLGGQQRVPEKIATTSQAVFTPKVKRCAQDPQLMRGIAPVEERRVGLALHRARPNWREKGMKK